VPIVRFVTPAAAPAPGSSYAGIKAFADKLQSLGYAYDPRYAGSNTNLGPTATAAVNDAPMLDPTMTPKVIVTGGSMATEKVRSAVKAVIDKGGTAGTAAATIAIVQGMGGTDYGNTYNNITGFHIDVLKTCIHQLHLIAAGAKVSILYDSSDDTSKPVHDYLQANTDRKTLHFYSKTDLAGDSTIIDGSTFMLIPNADFYNDRATIVGLVEGRLSDATKNVYAIYPEREYQEEHAKHGMGSKTRITVHGHHVKHTYRDAADLTGRILRNEVHVGTLPKMVEAKTDP
jgi:hypothetical protein